MPNAEGVSMWQNRNEWAKNSLFSIYVCSKSCQTLLGDVWKQNWSKVVYFEVPLRIVGHVLFVCFIYSRLSNFSAIRRLPKCQNTKMFLQSHMLKHKNNARLCGGQRLFRVACWNIKLMQDCVGVLLWNER